MFEKKEETPLVEVAVRVEKFPELEMNALPAPMAPVIDEKNDLRSTTY